MTKRKAVPIFSSASAELPGAIALVDAQAAAYAADGYARATGAPAIVVTRGEAEALQAASAMLTSWGDKQPVVAVNLLDPAGFAALDAVYAAVTRQSHAISSAADFDSACAALSRTLFDRAPAHLTIAERLFSPAMLQKLASLEWRRPAENFPQPAAGEVRSALDLLRTFRRPLLIAGRGAVALDPALVAEIALGWRAPILLTAGATAMPADRIAKWREIAERAVVVPSGNLAWTNLFTAADGILILGSALSEVDWLGLRQVRIARGKIVGVGREAPGGGKICSRWLEMEAGAFASALAEDLKRAGRGDGGGWLERAARTCAKWKELIAAEARKCGALDSIDPAFAAHQIVSGAPDDTIFVSEGGSCGMWMWSYLWMRPYVFPVQNGTIGASLPAAAGAMTAFPDRPVWSISGDGAFYYNIKELGKLARSGAALAAFVFNDGAWSSIRLGQTFIFGNRYIGTGIGGGKYAEVAALYGCESIVAETPAQLADAVARARKVKDHPLIIEVKLAGPDHVPYAGANFVMAELDGALRSLALPMLASAAVSAVHRRIPHRVIRGAIRMMRPG